MSTRLLSSGQEFDKKFLDSRHVLKVYLKPSRKFFFSIFTTSLCAGPAPNPPLNFWQIQKWKKKKKSPEITKSSKFFCHFMKVHAYFWQISTHWGLLSQLDSGLKIWVRWFNQIHRNPPPQWQFLSILRKVWWLWMDFISNKFST